MATKQQTMTKALVKVLSKVLTNTNGHRHPVKCKAKRVKGHAGKNGQHSEHCKGIFTPHCRAIITAGPRKGQRCGYCLDLYVGWRGLEDAILGPVCRKHFDAAMRKKAAARRRGY
jgi:hypothetical protein